MADGRDVHSRTAGDECLEARCHADTACGERSVLDGDGHGRRHDMAERNPEGLTTFYTAVSGFRMLLALGVMMVCYLVVGRDAMTVFFLVFMSFYVMLLVHHAVFFGKVSNRS